MPAIVRQVGRGAMSEQASATNDARDSSCRGREAPKLTRPTAGDYDRARSRFSVMSGFASPHFRLIARLCLRRLPLGLSTGLGSRFGATGLGAWLDLSRLALPWLNLPRLSATSLIARRQYHRPLAAIGLIRVIRVLRVLGMIGMIRMVRMLATPVAPPVVA